MTALCGVGIPSGPKSWVSPLFVVPGAAAANYIGNAGGMWASILAAALGTKVIDTATSCASDPPGWPATPTPGEIAAVAGISIGTADFTTGLQKLNQLFDNVMWYALCECKGVATPAQPAFPPAPAGAPAIAPTNGQLPQWHQCITLVPPYIGATGWGETSMGALDVSPQLLPFLGPSVNQVSAGGHTTISYAAPSPLPSFIRATLSTLNTAPLGVAFWIGGNPGIPTSALLSIDSHAGLGNAPKDSGMVAPPIGTYWAITVSQWGPALVNVPITVCIETYGPSNAGPGGCCPPDPTQAALAQQLVDLLKPLQRYAVPFAVVDGATHSGATGTSSSTIPQCIGIRIDVTAYPATNPVSGGNPPYVYDLGWVSVSSGDGMLIEKRLSQTAFQWLPDRCQLATRFNWFLRPGVTINWTELYAET